jgi:hypothetical protein
MHVKKMIYISRTGTPGSLVLPESTFIAWLKAAEIGLRQSVKTGGGQN